MQRSSGPVSFGFSSLESSGITNRTIGSPNDYDESHGLSPGGSPSNTSLKNELQVIIAILHLAPIKITFIRMFRSQVTQFLRPKILFLLEPNLLPKVVGLMVWVQMQNLHWLLMMSYQRPLRSKTLKRLPKAQLLDHKAQAKQKGLDLYGILDYILIYFWSQGAKKRKYSLPGA
jgi:hypothetical protein